MLELDAWLKIAKSAALEGGNYLLQNQGKELKVLMDSGRDIKLQLDTDTEKLIRLFIVPIITNSLPSNFFLGSLTLLCDDNQT